MIIWLLVICLLVAHWLLRIMVSLPWSTEIRTLNTDIVTAVWNSSWLKLTTGNWLCRWPLSESWPSCTLMKWLLVVAWLAMIDSRILCWCGMVHWGCYAAWSFGQQRRNSTRMMCRSFVLVPGTAFHGSLYLSHLSSAYCASRAHRPHFVCVECYKWW